VEYRAAIPQGEYLCGEKEFGYLPADQPQADQPQFSRLRRVPRRARGVVSQPNHKVTEKVEWFFPAD